MILFLGVVIMVTGTFGNLFAAVEHKSTHLSREEVGNSKYSQQIKLPLKMPSSTEMAKKYSGKDVSLVAPEKPVLHMSQEIPKLQIKLLENVRKEPPVPIAPLPSNKEKQKRQELPIGVMENKIKGETGKKTEPDQKKAKEDFAEIKHHENINKDAIEKEEREIMEVEQQKKAEEDRKQQELLQRLKEHQDEQKKLLQEQEKILKEMKDRKNENKLKEEPKGPDPFPGEAKTIKPDEFSANIKKIQNVIDDLENTKKILKKEKSPEREKAVAGKNASEGRGGEEPRHSPERSEEKAAVEAKAPAASVPLPLAKRFSAEEKKGKKAQEGETETRKEKEEKGEVLGGDILVERRSGREKRDADEGRGKCANDESRGETASNSGEKEKTEKVGEKEKRKNGTEEMAVLIKNSAHLSVSLAEEKKGQMGSADTPNFIFDFQNHPFMSKKRDLKSVSATNS